MLCVLAAGGPGEDVQLLRCQSWAAVTFSIVLKPYAMLQSGMFCDASVANVGHS